MKTSKNIERNPYHKTFQDLKSSTKHDEDRIAGNLDPRSHPQVQNIRVIRLQSPIGDQLRKLLSGIKLIVKQFGR